LHSCSSNLELIIALPKQHYNNPKHTWQLRPHVEPTLVEAALLCNEPFVSLLRIGARWTFSLSRWSKNTLSYSNLHNFVIRSPILLTTPSTSTLCGNADRIITCPIRASVAGVMIVLTSTILGATPGSLLSHHNAPLECWALFLGNTSLSDGHCP
jgi:hypothetical protein